jgi:hypothetical protein
MLTRYTKTATDTEGYTPPVPTPEQIREGCEKCIWNARRGIWFAKRMLDHANSNEQRERALKSLQMWKKMLARNQAKLAWQDGPHNQTKSDAETNAIDVVCEDVDTVQAPENAPK